MPGLRDIFSRVNDPFHRRRNPLDVGNANDKNYNNFMNTDYSAFKDPQGNYAPSSLIGTAVPPLGGTPPPATTTLGGTPPPATPAPSSGPVNTAGLPMPGAGRLPNMTPAALPPPATEAPRMDLWPSDSFNNTFTNTLGGPMSIARDFAGTDMANTGADPYGAMRQGQAETPDKAAWRTRASILTTQRTNG